MNAQVGPAQLGQISDVDRDSLHILPLAIVPLTLPGLRRARLVKNARLETVVEFFSESDCGSGQVAIGEIGKLYNVPKTDLHPDIALLRQLELMPSFDVFSLRILLRECNIPIREGTSLTLSQDKVRELDSYMTSFTHPLIAEIFGRDDVAMQSFEDVVALFRNPDIRKVREQLNRMVAKLGIELHEIPQFLEDYADISLSLAYYRNCLDSIVPIIEQFMASMKGLRGNFQMRNDANLMRATAMIETRINDLLANVTGRFENFDRSTKAMWQDLSAEKFRRVEALIKSYHTSIGGVLCALSVKMNAWARLFPNEETGGPVRRAEFVMAEMKQGIERMRAIDDSAPMLASIGQ
jgi:hypothetical protein